MSSLWPRRDEALASLRRLVEALGGEELAFATYPQNGADAGNTFVLLIRASQNDVEMAAWAMAESLNS